LVWLKVLKIGFYIKVLKSKQGFPAKAILYNQMLLCEVDNKSLSLQSWALSVVASLFT